MNLMSETITEPKLEPSTHELYLATEVRHENAFACSALGRGIYTEGQLRQWAERIGAKLVLLKRDNE